MFATASLYLMAQAGLGGAEMVMLLCLLAVAVLLVASMWIINTKAGYPGWAAIVPIYNTIVLCQIAGKPGWWVLLTFIPFVGFIISIIVSIGIAENFGKGTGFALGLIFIFYPLLAFGDAEYIGERGDAY